MSIFDRLFRKKSVVEILSEKLLQDEPIAYPIGYHREGDDQIIVEPEYLAKWTKQYPDKFISVSKMLAFLKSQYPDVSKFLIRK